MFSRNVQQTTYGGRKRHRSSSNPVPTSSPVKKATLSENETSVAEMSRRMKKRSRMALRQKSGGGGTTQSDGAEIDEHNEETERPLKKRKGMLNDSESRAPLGEKLVDRNAQLASGQQHLDTHMEEDEDEVVVKTPAARSRPPIVQPPKSSRESESLSPLPVSSRSRRILKTRASSKYLKENLPQDSNPRSLLTSTSLASPFHSQHATPVTSPKPSATENEAVNSVVVENAQKNSRTKIATTRTRSAASATARHLANRSGPNSPSAHSSIHRRPSESNLQTKNKQRWLVPAQTDEIAKKTTAYRPSRLNQSFSREGSFFDGVPQACSTPMHPTRSLQIDTDATPRLPFHHKEVKPPVRSVSMALEDETPRVATSLRTFAPRALSNDSIFDGSISPEHGESSGSVAGEPLARKSMRRATVHVPEDSIFSSAMDISVSVDAPNPSSLTSSRPPTSSHPALPQETAAPPGSPTAQGSPHSSEGGDELRDMFSILGLDEIGMMDSRLSNPIDALVPVSASQEQKKPRGLGSRISSIKHSISSIKTKKPGSSSLRHRHTPYPSISQNNIRTSRNSPIRSSSDSGERPTLRMKILEKPLEPSSSSDDELLLTSKGWKYGHE